MGTIVFVIVDSTLCTLCYGSMFLWHMPYVCITILLFFVRIFLTAILHPNNSPILNIADTILWLVLISTGISILSTRVVYYNSAPRELFQIFICTYQCLCCVAIPLCTFLHFILQTACSQICTGDLCYNTLQPSMVPLACLYNIILYKYVTLTVFYME